MLAENAQVRLWDPATGREVVNPLKGHTKHINWIAWEPLHL